MTMVFHNVSCPAFACIRRHMYHMMKHHAAKHGFVIEQISFPPCNRATWYCRMTKNGKTREMVIRVNRDPFTGNVMLHYSQNIMSDSHMKHMLHMAHHHC